jgi:transcriptional regulator with XRE-family HTH domain
MKTVGEILQISRKNKQLSKKEVSQKTKISVKYIKALEENDFEHLPEAAFVKGFIRNYAQVVDVNPDQILAIFRRDYDQNLKGKVIPRDFNADFQRRRIFWNPKTTMLIFSLIVILFLSFYFINQYNFLISAPKLNVIYPKEQEMVISTVTIEGITDPQATITINNQQVKVEKDGSFSQAINLHGGIRTITVQATNRFGKSRTIQRTVQVKE